MDEIICELKLTATQLRILLQSLEYMRDHKFISAGSMLVYMNLHENLERIANDNNIEPFIK